MPSILDEPPVEKKEEVPFTLREKLEKLRQDLEAQNPGFATVLSEIHSLTKQNPEFVYSLSDEELQTIFAGSSKYHQVVMQTEKPKKAGKSRIVSVDEI